MSLLTTVIVLEVRFVERLSFSVIALPSLGLLCAFKALLSRLPSRCVQLYRLRPIVIVALTRSLALRGGISSLRDKLSLFLYLSLVDPLVDTKC
jgi:hypothetical protein